MSTDYKCDKCKKEIDFEEVGYLGAVDRNNTECSPFMNFETICVECEENRK
jgi:hypothetical protein